MINNKKIEDSINKKFIRPLNDGIRYNINKIEYIDNIKHKETVWLLKKTFDTLNNAEYLLNKNSFVDSNALLRCAYEYLLVGVMMQFEENVYAEFIDLSMGEEKIRDYTCIKKLINKFKTHMNDIDKEIFSHLNRTIKGDLLVELYDKLCKYIHSTPMVIAMYNIENDNKKIIKLINYHNFYLVKILLFSCLKYFTNDKTHYIKSENLVFSYLFNLLLIGDKLKNSEETLKKYNAYLHIEENAEYLNKLELKMKKQSQKMKNDFEDVDNEKFWKSLKEFLDI